MERKSDDVGEDRTDGGAGRNGRTDDGPGRTGRADEGLGRREFLRVAGAAAAAGAVAPTDLLAAHPASSGGAAPARVIQERQEAPPVPLDNGEHPALVFQAYPGGTGSLYRRWAREGVDPFERHPIPIDPWVGPVPGDPADVAFLPVHRLAALIRGGHVSSVELTEIYLERLKRYDPTLLFAVTILEERALEEARQADIDLANGIYHGPLHGIPYGVKDLFSVEGTRTTWGSADYEDRVIDEDADRKSVV